MTAIWSADPAIKVSDARLSPAWTSEECSGCGNEISNVITAIIRLIGYAVRSPLATATPVIRYAIQPAKTE